MGTSYDVNDYHDALNFVVREDADTRLPEQVVQQFWYDFGAKAGPVTTLEGHPLEVVSPGWWNHCAGPDFQGAQLRFNDVLFTGDVEIHLDQACWVQHGHHVDPRYNDVLLHVLLNPPQSSVPVLNAAGRELPHLCLDSLCTLAEGTLQPLTDVETRPDLAPRCHGSCNRFVAQGRPEILTDFLALSGDWRLLHKTRYVQERMAKVGPDQTAYELIARALGYRPFTDNFERLACAIPYDRALQLARQEPFLLEATLLHLGGLLPGDATAQETLPPHGERLARLRDAHLPNLTALDMTWPLAGVRPNNYPSRRMAGLAAFLVRVASDGLVGTLERLWKTHDSPIPLRRAFEGLFPNAMGFWATHHTLTARAMPKATSPVGTGRVRSIIGNVFVPLALAQARNAGQRSWEDQIFDFYHRLPMEPDNQIYRRMVPRILGDFPLRFNFQTQQGLLQLHEDWCKTNPSCRNCTLLAYLEGRERTSKT